MLSLLVVLLLLLILSNLYIYYCSCTARSNRFENAFLLHASVAISLILLKYARDYSRVRFVTSAVFSCAITNLALTNGFLHIFNYVLLMPSACSCCFFNFCNTSNEILAFLLVQTTTVSSCVCIACVAILTFSRWRGCKFKNWDPRARWEALFFLIPVLRGSANFAFFNTSAVGMLETLLS